MTWRDKTCEDCASRVDKVCRRVPPITSKEGKRWVTRYPLVKLTSKKYPFVPACAEHATELQQLTIKEVVR